MKDIRKRPNPENVKRIEAYIEKIRAEIGEINHIVKLKDSDEWQHISNIIERKLAGVEFEMENFSSLSEKDIHCCLQMRRDLQFFLSLVNGGEKALNDLHKKLDEALEELSYLKSRLGLK